MIIFIWHGEISHLRDGIIFDTFIMNFLGRNGNESKQPVLQTQV